MAAFWWLKVVLELRPLSGVYTANLFDDLEFYLGQILSLYEAKCLGKYLAQIFCFIEGQYLAQLIFQIVKQIGRLDAALRPLHVHVRMFIF